MECYDDSDEIGTLALIKLSTFPKWDTGVGRQLCMQIPKMVMTNIYKEDFFRSIFSFLLQRADGYGRVT